MRARQGTKDQSGIERLCLDRGLTMTGQRRVIARVLSDATDHPSVEEVHRRALLLDENISIGKNRSKTIGRNEKDKIGNNWSIKVGSFKTETIGLAYMQNVGLAKMVNIGAAGEG